MELFLKDISQVILAIGALAFLVSVITEALKKWSWFDEKVPTPLTAILVSVIVCPVSMIGMLSYYEVVIEWYMVYGSFMAAFIVALVSMDGWERITDIMNRSLKK